VIFTRDSNNKKILIDNNYKILIDNKYENYQTMMEWEKPYMDFLVDNLKPHGEVLEIGFGLGFSFNQIQKYNIKSHTVIECNKQVIEKITNKNVKIIEGYWQEVFDRLDKYDCIFFDDAPNNKYNKKDRFSQFLMQILKHVKQGTRLTWYCDGDEFNLDLSNYPGTIEIKKFDIKIPKNCKYTKAKDYMLAPVLTFDQVDPSRI
tara:strand:- start:5 stop:616 length:612 start_codon:yes stop_codon:yes gene_type:complete